MAAPLMQETQIGPDTQLPTAEYASDYERDLILQAKSGSASAFKQLIERYEGRIFRVAQNITRRRQDAEDVVQNAFVRAFRNLFQFRGDSRFYTWLVRIAVNEALGKVLRHCANEVSIDELIAIGDALVPLEVQDWGPNPESRFSQQELRNILTAAIKKLEPGYRTVFQLRDIEGLSTEETAQALGMTSWAVKSRLHWARMRLRNSLDKHFRPMGTSAEQAVGESNKVRQRRPTRRR